uniref:hypothetical protein n=1 Tax=Saccharomonospora viridis TaxID=1852 RepID=UPI003C6E40FC
TPTMDRQDVPSPDAGDEVHVPDPQDAVDPILGSAVGAEDLDEDRMQTDPLEEGMDPPEGWSGADRYGTTAREQRDGESLEQRLWQERSETAPPSPGAAPGEDRAEVTGAADTEVTEVPLPEGDDVGPDEVPGRGTGEPMSRQGRAADQAGGSMAQAVRTEGFDPPGPASAGTVEPDADPDDIGEGPAK